MSRVSVKRSLSHVYKSKFNNGETKNPFHEFSFKHSSNFFLCVGYFPRKNIVFVFPHLSNLAVTIEFTELLFSTCSRYCWNHCHFIFFSFFLQREEAYPGFFKEGVILWQSEGTHQIVMSTSTVSALCDMFRML